MAPFTVVSCLAANRKRMFSDGLFGEGHLITESVCTHRTIQSTCDRKGKPKEI